MQFSDLDLNGTYTYADYLQWAFEERLELIKGKIFRMAAAPARLHQRISWIVSGELYVYLKNRPCQAYTAPFDVRLPYGKTDDFSDKEAFTVVQPDISIICNPDTKIDSRGCLGAPDIVVEILSPGNNQRELRNKYEVYEEAGVQEYWILHPSEKTFLKYTLDGQGRYQPSRLLTLGDEVTTPILPSFVLSLDTVFENID